MPKITRCWCDQKSNASAFLTPSHCPVFDLPEVRSKVDDGTPRVPTPFGAPERDARKRSGTWRSFAKPRLTVHIG
jgi:hypothetical protein